MPVVEAVTECVLFQLLCLFVLDDAFVPLRVKSNNMISEIHGCVKYVYVFLSIIALVIK